MKIVKLIGEFDTYLFTDKEFKKALSVFKEGQIYHNQRLDMYVSKSCFKSAITPDIYKCADVFHIVDIKEKAKLGYIRKDGSKLLDQNLYKEKKSGRFYYIGNINKYKTDNFFQNDIVNESKIMLLEDYYNSFYD